MYGFISEKLSDNDNTIDICLYFVYKECFICTLQLYSYFLIASHRIPSRSVKWPLSQ